MIQDEALVAAEILFTANYLPLAKKKIVVDMRFITDYQSLAEPRLKSGFKNQNSPKDRGSVQRKGFKAKVYRTVAGPSPGYLSSTLPLPQVEAVTSRRKRVTLFVWAVAEWVQSIFVRKILSRPISRGACRTLPSNEN